MSPEMTAVVLIVPRSPERVAARTNISDDLIEDTRLPYRTVKEAITRQKVDALTDRIEMASAKDELQNYLREGRSDSSYKNREVRFIEASRMRELTLRAGYTEFALGLMNRMGTTDLERSERFPQNESDRLAITVKSPNIYGLEEGRYDEVEVVDWLINNKEPDYPSGRDPLRRQVLREIEEVGDIRKSLIEKGKHVFSLSMWDKSTAGKTYFLLNPGYADEARFGWYTVPELRGWLNNNPRSRVLKVNQKEKPMKEKRHYWKSRYAENLGRLVKRKDVEGQRLFRMALMGCPFEDLVERYVK